MLYELRTYNLTANSVPEVERRFAEKIEARMKLSPLVGFWHTDIGPLNQIVHLWAYESLQHRADTRAKAIADKVWPPDITEFIVSMESDILTPSPVNDPLDGPREWGNLYELRMYTYPSGRFVRSCSSSPNRRRGVWRFRRAASSPATWGNSTASISSGRTRTGIIGTK